MRRISLGLLGVLLIAPSLAVSTAYAETTKVTPQITLVAASKLSYDNRTTTVTGTVTTPSADGTAAVPLTGQVVTITCYKSCEDHLGGAIGDVTTDGTGRFTLPVTAKWSTMSVTAEIDGSDSTEPASTTLWLSPRTETRLTVSASPYVISDASRDSTFSGRFDYLGDDSVWKPLPGRTLGIRGAGAGTSVVTEADGSFSKTVTLTPPPYGTVQQVRVSFSPSNIPVSTENQIFFDAVGKDLNIYPSMGMAITNVRASMNTSARASFRAMVTGGRGNGPIPMRIEHSTDGTTGWKFVAHANAEADGTLDANFPAVGVPAYYRAVIVAANGDALVISDAARVDRIPTSITGFKASVDAEAYLSVSGTVNVGGDGGTTSVDIEYSSTGKSGWKRLATFAAEGAFAKKYDAPLPTAYYRAKIIEGTHVKGSTSSVVKAGRIMTRITGVKFSATKVKKGSTFTISGTLQRYTSGKWRPLTKQKVWMVFRLRGSNTLYWYSKPVTSSTGRFTAKIKASKPAYWLPTFYAPAGYYSSSASKPVFVTVS